MVALIRKVERRFEPRDQIEQFCVDLRNAFRQRAFELVECRTSLQRGDGIDEIGHGFSLHKIDPAVQKCAKGELARLGETRATLHRLLDDLSQYDRAAMRADLDDILAGV